ILLDGCKKIFEDGLVAAEISDGGGRRALVFVLGGFVETSEGCGNSVGAWSISQVGRDDTVVFEDHGAFAARDFDAAWVAGIGGRGGVKYTEGATCEFQRGNGGVFSFDFVKPRSGGGLH